MKTEELNTYQLLLADVNGDGEITALDCAEIAKFLAAQAMAKAEGMFVEQQ